MALSGWSDYFTITIDTSKYSANLTGVTIPVHLSESCGLDSFDASAIFTALGSNYLKMAAELDGSGVELHIEVERWDETGKIAVLHIGPVDIDTSPATHELVLYYDPTHADNSTYVGLAGSTAAESVWDSSGKLISNMAQDPSGTAPQMLDSTSNGNDGTSYGSMTTGDLVDTVYGKGLDFDRTDDYVNFGDLGSFPEQGTIEAFFKPASTSYDQNAYTTEYNGGNTNELRLAMGSNGNMYVVFNGVHFSLGAYSANTWYHCMLTWNKTTNKFSVILNSTVKYNDGVNSAWPSTIPSLSAANGYNTTFQLLGIITTLRYYSGVRQSTAWAECLYNGFNDTLVTITPGFWLLDSALDQLYGAGPVDPTALVQVWGLLHDPATIALVQNYHVFYGLVVADLEVVYGFELAVILRQPYGNAARLLAALRQYYGDAKVVKLGLTQKWADALKLDTTLEQRYSVFAELVTGLAQRYAITEGEVLQVLSQLWDISSLQTPISTALAQVWGMLGSFNILQYSFVVVMGGTVLQSVELVSITEDLDQYLIRAEITLTSQAEYALISDGVSLQIIVSGITYELFVAEKSRSKSRDLYTPRLDYNIVGLSLTAGLDVPRSSPLTMDWPSGGVASEIVGELAEGFVVDWQLPIDWPVAPGTLFANNESRIEVIRKIIRNRGLVQTAPDGTLLIIPEYKISPPDWPTAAVDHTFSELDDIYTASESWDERDGTNCVYVTDRLEADEQFRLPQEQVDSNSYYLRGYRVPWDAGFSLYNSGGSWVQMQSFGVVAETHIEQIEFIDGRGQVANPMYALGAVDWLQDQLGAITFGEDGSLQSEIIGNSLADITYTSRCRKWLVTDNNNESVQFWIQEDD